MGALATAMATLLMPSAVPAQTDVSDGVLPVDAISRVGDERIGFPEYFSERYGAPGATVAAVGDVNHDGLEDSAMYLDSFEPSYPGSVWVNFSQPTLPLTVEAGQLPWRGFRITGGWMGFVVKGIGDVNGDLLGDVVVMNNGELVVVFGRLDGETVQLDRLGGDGFRITGVGACPTGGAGTSSGGILMENKLVTALGDQNGDGVQELAFCSDEVVRVVFIPPNPAGKVVDARSLGANGFTLDPSVNAHNGPLPDRLGDLNGDGREDLAVVWQERNDENDTLHTVHAAGVASPPAGSTVNLNQVAETGRGFELHAPDSYLENALTIGDQNGDGIREVAWTAFGVETYRDRTLVMTYSPPIGTERVAYPVAPGTGEEIDTYGGEVSDVGDQDGDGKSDIAYDHVVWLSGGARYVGQPGSPDELGGRMYIGSKYMIADSLADRNLDGKRELMAVHADPYSDESNDHRAKYFLDTFLSAPLPIPEQLDPPVEAGDTLEFGGRFATARTDDSRTFAGRPYVELQSPSGRTFLAAGGIVDTNRRQTAVAVGLDPAAMGLKPGCGYRYRLLLDNSRGVVGATGWGLFDYRPSEPCPVSSGERIEGTSQADVLRGTAGDDRIRGKAGDDRILGLAGDDRLSGGSGDDRINGGPGDDEIAGGAGGDRISGGTGKDRLAGNGGEDVLRARDGQRDRVRCGGGDDVAKIDARDDASGCERLARR